MSARTRWSTVLVAGGTAVMLLAGCGGSPIEEAATPTGAESVAASDTTGAVAVSAGPGAAQPRVATGTTPASPETATGATGPKGTGTTGGSGAAASPSKPTGGKAAVGTVSAVEGLVASHPIFGGTGACKPATLSEIPIGNVSTLSGVIGETVAPVRSALEIFVASQNACGGLNGHKIKLYIEDDQGDPSTASSKVQGLIQSKKVLALVGNIQVLTIDAVIPVVKRFGIPLIGGDLASNTWFTNPLLFPQGTAPAAVAYGYLQGATRYFKKTNVGDMWCLEIPRGCEQNDRAFKELAPQFGATVKKSIQASITSPSYVQQCLDFKSSGVEALALLVDAPTMVRLARSCEQVGYFPNIMPTPLGVGNQKQFLNGNKWLGNAYMPLNYFPWFASETPAQKYWQAAARKYNPGADMGTMSSAGWTAGALLVAAAAELSPTAPTSADLLKGLYTFKGQKWTGLGGLSGPRTFTEGSIPRVPYCLFSAISNASNTGWQSAVATPQCTDTLAPSDPQNTG